MRGRGTERQTGEGRVGRGEEEKDREELLSALPTDTTCQLDVFGHDGDTLGMDGAQVGVLKQTHQVGLAGLLQGRETGRRQLSLELNSWFGQVKYYINVHLGFTNEH